ncbi:hypothetical protein PR048_025764 [Dryococelus australis]|uniref:Uncharacterized protein n=1 Tax=Dryococelus australis TaxID=614101 RepID=A0ABQ9GJG0_9NEOP|nr:hypothetical protein PR048_025764 [Dryococelus australis]
MNKHLRLEWTRDCGVYPTAVCPRFTGQSWSYLGGGGPAVAERLACSPSTKASRGQSPATSSNFCKWELCRDDSRWSAGFLGDLPFLPPFHSGAAPYIPQSPSSAIKTYLTSVAERLDCSPPTNANRVQTPAGSLRILARRNRAGRCRCTMGFLRISNFPVLLHSHLISPSSTLKTPLIVLPSTQSKVKVEGQGHQHLTWLMRSMVDLARVICVVSLVDLTGIKTWTSYMYVTGRGQGHPDPTWRLSDRNDRAGCWLRLRTFSPLCSTHLNNSTGIILRRKRLEIWVLCGHKQVPPHLKFVTHSGPVYTIMYITHV